MAGEGRFLLQTSLGLCFRRRPRRCEGKKAMRDLLRQLWLVGWVL